MNLGYIPSPKISLKSVTTQILMNLVDTKPKNIAKISNYSNPHESGWTPSPKSSLKSVTTQILMKQGGYEARIYC